MPRAGGGSAANDSSNIKTQGKSSKTAAPMPLDRILNVSVLQHTPRMTFDFVKSVVPEVGQFEVEWINDDLTGAALVSEGPANFYSVLKSSFGDMTAPIRSKIFSCFKNRLVEENHKGNDFISADLIKLWFPPGEINPTQLFSDFPPSAVQGPVLIGKPNHAFFKAQPPAYLGLPSFSNVAGHPQPSLQVDHAAQPSLQAFKVPPPPPSSVAFQSPVAGKSPQASLASQAGQVASAALPGVGASAAPNSVQVPPSIDEQFAASKSLFQAQGLSLNVSVKLPWVVHAEQNTIAVQDPTMPLGFDRVDVHAKIAKAVSDRIAKGAIGTHQNVKKVVWPTMTEFNAAGYRECRAQFYECVLASLTSAIFQEFKDCLDSVPRTAACTTFHLTDNMFADLPDAQFMQWCDIFFGPKSASQALQSLSEIRLAPHRDKNHSQSTFVKKFDLMNHTFLFAVNDIVKCHTFWPQAETQSFGSSFDVSTIMSKWSKAFPKQNPSSPNSIQAHHCLEFYNINKKMPFRDLIRVLRLKFATIDMEVVAGERAYTTVPTEPLSDQLPSRKPAPAVNGNPLSTPQSTPYRGAGRSQMQPRGQDRRPPQSTARSPSFNKKPDSGPRRSIQKERNVPGHLRCVGCGHPNNHHGLGPGAGSCPLHGTQWAKPKGYVWKSTSDEKSVRVPKPQYDALLAAKPHIEKNWTAAKDAKKVHVAAIRALTGQDDGMTNSESESIDDHNVYGSDDAPSDDNKSDDYASELAVSELAQNPFADVAAVLIEPHPLERFGYMPQFFAVARFAQNDSLRSQCLMDPGGAINIISPMLANRSAVERICTNVSIYTGNRKTGSVSEMVRVLFELMDAKGNYVKHSEYFAVSDMGYAMLLGRKFCKDNGFTSFDDKLTSFDDFKVGLSHDAQIAALATAPPPKPTLQLFFTRETLSPGDNRYKRKPKSVIASCNREADANSISSKVLDCVSKFSQLRIVDRAPQANGNDHVLLEFCLSRDDNKAKRIFHQSWFIVDSSLSNGCIITPDLATDLGFAFDSKPAPVSDTHATPVPSFGARDPAVADGLTNQFFVNQGLAVPDRDEKVKLRALNHRAAVAAMSSTDAERFVSKHPISKYELKRRAEPPLSPHWKHDHRNFRYDRLNKLSQIAALEADAMRNFPSSSPSCERKRHQLRKTIDEIKKSVGLKSLDDCLDELESDRLLAAQLAALVPQAESVCKSADFAPGKYVEIFNATLQPQFNGQRARLHRVHSSVPSPSGTSTADNLWEIRVLGKNQGLWLCRESRLKLLPALEQQRSRPHPADAAFDDVGIDNSGQPDVDTKLLAHRQFGSEYSAALTKRIEELKAKFPKVFTTDVSEPCTFAPMKIKLKPNCVLPGKARFYRNTPKMREEVRRQIQEQLDWGAVRRCVTPHVSDVLLVKRPHMPGKFRFVVSYVKLNEAIEDEQLIMPDARTQHERLAGKKIFGAFDFSSYYRQIRLHEDSQYLTGFASDEGTFCYCTVPMGIKTACAYSQRVLQEALQDDPVLGPLGLKNYFDDLPFAADTEEEFLFIFEALLNFCSNHKLKVNPEKSVFGVTSITHVGFVVSKDGVSIDPERSRDLAELSPPKSIKKVQSILGVLNYVRNFVPNFSDKARFLTDKLVAVKPASSAVKLKRPRARDMLPSTFAAAAAMGAAAVKPGRVAKAKVVLPFHWSQEDQQAFEALKAEVLSCPMLACLDYAKPIFVRCDASRFGAGAVLFQYDDRGFEHPVCYASRKFLPAERNWSTFAQEASTVVWALERFAEFTQGYHVVVECDHRNISFVKRSSMPQIARWRLRLQDMDFSIRYLSGPNNSCSDGLSRQHVDDDDVGVDYEDVLPECALADATAEQRKLLAEIAEIAAVRVDYVDAAPLGARAGGSSGAAAAEDEDIVAEDAFAEQFCNGQSSDSDSDASDVVQEPLFGPNGELLDEAGMPIVEPQQQPPHLRVPVLDAAVEFAAVHNDLVGHGGAYVTLQRALTNSRSWASKAQMLKDIDAFIQSCPCCQKMRKRSSRSLVDRHTISGSPFSQLSVDILKLPNPDVYGYGYIVVIVDNFSHWTSLVAVRNKSAVDAARAVMQVVGNFGAPLSLRSDGGGEFVNGVITGVTRMLNIAQHVVLPYTPEANGIVERANRSILERLRVMIFSKRIVQHPHHVWSDLLPLVQRSINASFHSAIGTSPAKILFGENLDLDRCLLTKTPANRTVDVQTYVGALSFNQRVIIEEADRFQAAVCNRVIAKARASQRTRGSDGALLDAAPKMLQEGAWVLVKPQESFPLHKLAPRWLGPFRVHRFSEDSEVVTVFDTIKNKYRRFLKRQIEEFNVNQLAAAEGLSVVAETDHFEFPVDAIIGHALINEGGIGAEPVQLGSEFRRGSRHKKTFQFLIKWTNYEETSWISYGTASRLAQFPGYVSQYPGLAMLA